MFIFFTIILKLRRIFKLFTRHRLIRQFYSISKLQTLSGWSISYINSKFVSVICNLISKLGRYIYLIYQLEIRSLINPCPLSYRKRSLYIVHARGQQCVLKHRILHFLILLIDIDLVMSYSLISTVHPPCFN